MLVITVYMYIVDWKPTFIHDNFILKLIGTELVRGDWYAVYLFENWFAARNNHFEKALTNLANISCMQIKVGL